MAFELVGKLHKKFETMQKTESFKAREFVVETEGDYPQFVKFQCTQDRCAMIDQFEEGGKVKVHFDLRGREWQGKYFTNLNAWKVEGEAAAVPDNFNQDIPVGEPPMDNGSDDYDDLPF